MNREIGDNGGPDIEGRKESVRTSWAKALFADPETPVYVIAMAWPIHWYSRPDGSGAALSNKQFSEICGISEDTVSRGKKWLRDKGYVELQVGTGMQKTRFRMSIPATATDDAEGVRHERREGPHTADPAHSGGPHTAVEGPHTAGGGSAPTGSVFNKESINTPDKSGRHETGSSFWKAAVNPHHSDYLIGDGKLTLVNGTRSRWLIEFSDDAKRLDLALIEVAGRIQPNSSRPVEAQIEAHLAKLAGEKRDRDARYAQAAKANKQPSPTDPARKSWATAKR